MKTPYSLLRALALTGVLAAGFFSPSARATNYYVDPVSGNNGNDGLGTNTAFLTIQHALDGAQPGDTVNLRGGVYRPIQQLPYYDVVRSTVGGTATQPLTVQSYQNEKPIIKGSLVVTGWGEVNGDEFTTNRFPSESAGHIYKQTNWMCDATGKLKLSYGQWSYA